MHNDKRDLDPHRLYDFVLALAGSDTTITEYSNMCNQLWDRSEHRPWLIAALMRKVGTLEGDPDRICVEFLSRKVHEVLAATNPEQAPVAENLVQLLPIVIQLVPDEVWTNAWNLWNDLLKRMAEELGMTFPGVIEQESRLDQGKAADLADLFAAAIGSPWTKALNDRLESWRNDPDYVWLVALRRARQLDTLLARSRRQLMATSLLEDPGLLNRLEVLSSFDRRRFLFLHNAVTKENIMTDPIIETIASKITWRFKVMIDGSIDIWIIAAQQTVGQVSLNRAEDGIITVGQAAGICTALVEEPLAVLVPKRAAAIELNTYIRLTASLKGTLQAVPDGIVLQLQWRAKESNP